MQRYLVVKKNENIIFDEQDIHHIKNVMRRKIGDKIIAFYSNKEFLVQIVTLTPFVVKIVNESDIDTELKPRVTLLLAILKKDNFEFVLEKAVELGASDVVPVITNRVIKRFGKEEFQQRLTRWQRIIKEATEQSGRSVPLTLHPPVTLKEVISFKSELNIVANPGGQVSLKNLAPNYSSYTLFIGPEGGFETQEIQQLVEDGFAVVTLGKRVLRAETAALTLLSYVMLRED